MTIEKVSGLSVAQETVGSHRMLTEMETMTELADIKSEIGASDFHGSGTGSVDSNSSSATPQPHQNFSWVRQQSFNYVKF